MLVIQSCEALKVTGRHVEQIERMQEKMKDENLKTMVEPMHSVVNDWWKWVQSCLLLTHDIKGRNKLPNVVDISPQHYQPCKPFGNATGQK